MASDFDAVRIVNGVLIIPNTRCPFQTHGLMADVCCATTEDHRGAIPRFENKTPALHIFPSPAHYAAYVRSVIEFITHSGHVYNLAVTAEEMEILEAQIRGIDPFPPMEPMLPRELARAPVSVPAPLPAPPPPASMAADVAALTSHMQDVELAEAHDPYRTIFGYFVEYAKNYPDRVRDMLRTLEVR